jgi:hypothetical protein
VVVPVDGFTYDGPLTLGCSAGFSGSSREVFLTSVIGTVAFFSTNGIAGGADGIGFEVAMIGLPSKLGNGSLTLGCSAAFTVGCVEIGFSSFAGAAGVHLSDPITGGGAGIGFEVLDADALIFGGSSAFGTCFKEVAFNFGAAGAHSSDGSAGGGGGSGTMEPVFGLRYKLDDGLPASLSDPV